jgi:DNA-binding NarL/FixJ family response regulator
LGRVEGQDGRARDGRGVDYNERLTPRELDDVLPLMVRGFTNREIGAELSVSPATARVHVERIMGKLGASNRARAVYAALSLGMVLIGETDARSAVVRLREVLVRALDGYLGRGKV